jgi:ectoine hydroxylase-related dioxygenase (phytanoyl-CoA dioxygenase family)
MTYQFEKYVTDEQRLMDTLNTYGVAIIPNVLSEEECYDMNLGMWNTLETLTQTWDVSINRNKHETWRQMRNLYPSHSMLIQHWNVGHAQYVWNLRQNSKIVNIFSKIWDCKNDELLVSFDGVSYHMPPEITEIGWYRGNKWLHSDQSFTDSSFKCVQSWVTGYDVNEGDATLCLLEGSHKFHEECKKKFGIVEKKDWYKLNDEEMNFYENEKGCENVRIKCPKGSLVLWDSRTIHSGAEALKTRKHLNFRNVVYLCYHPRSMANSKQIEKKKKAFQEMRMTSHWPCKVTLFPKIPRTYGGEIYEMTQLEPPILNELGMKLAGF